ncbi:MAG: ABC transporter permease, partial [Pseudoclavibacter sp.]
RTASDVRELVFDAFGPTMQLVFWGVLLGAVVALLVGVYSATRRNTVGDHTLTTVSYIGISLPAFWFGLLLIQFLGTMPTRIFDLREPPLFFVGLAEWGDGPFEYVRHLVLPVITLTITLVAAWSRFARSSMIEVLAADYVRTARAKGVPRGQVIARHALRNALAPFVTVVALDAALLIGGLVVTEQIYSVPGMGKLFIDSLLAGDVFVIVPWMIIVAIAVILCNLLADIGYAILDPRVKLR